MTVNAILDGMDEFNVESGWVKAAAFGFCFLIFAVGMFFSLDNKLQGLKAAQETALEEVLDAGLGFPQDITQQVAQKNMAAIQWGSFAYWIVMLGLLSFAIVYGVNCMIYCLSN